MACAVLAAGLILAPVAALAQQAAAEAPDVETRSTPQRAFDVVFDLALLRTSGLVTTAVGSALFVPAAAISAPGGREPLREGLERFVLTPFNWFWRRPLGDF